MERQPQIDILKALAIIGVILIHITSNAFALYPQKSIAWHSFLILDQLMRFSVPLFVALSGYTLAISDQRRHLSLKNFYLRRAFRIIPYYLVATVIIYVYLSSVSPWSQTKNPYPFWQIILLGRADYHLYFIPMIFQLYLAFPFILKAFKKWPKATLVAAFLTQSLIFISTALVFNRLIEFPFTWGDQQQYLIAPTWIFYFVLGISLSGIDRFSAKNLNLTKIFAVMLAVGGLVLTVLESFRILAVHQNLIEATRSTRFPVMVFATGAILASIIFAKNLLKIPKFAVTILAKVGLISFSIYLLHTLAIRIIILQIKPYPILSFIIFTAASLLLSLIFAWIFEEAFKITKNLRQALLLRKAR